MTGHIAMSVVWFALHLVLNLMLAAFCFYSGLTVWAARKWAQIGRAHV